MGGYGSRASRVGIAHGMQLTYGVAFTRVESLRSPTVLGVVVDEHIIGDGQQRPLHVHLAGNHHLQDGEKSCIQ